MLEVWMAFLKNPLNEEIKDVTEVQRALYALQEVSENPEDREIYYLRQQTEFGYLSEKNIAIEKARNEERAKAKKELAEQQAKAEAEKIEMAKNFLKIGLSVEQVAAGTGLSIEKIRNI